MKKYLNDMKHNSEIDIPTNLDISAPKIIRIFRVVEKDGEFELTEGVQFSFEEAEKGDQPEIKKNEQKKKQKVEWSDVATQLLINCRIEKENDFQKPIAKAKLWNQISQALQDKGVKFTGEECSHKWRNLMCTFRQNLDKLKTSGEGKIRWEHFNKFYEVYGGKTNNNPPPHYLSSSIASPASPSPCTSVSAVYTSGCNSPAANTATTSSENNTSDSANLDSPCPSTSLTRENRKRKREPPAWFLEEMAKRDAKDEQRWKEVKEIEEKKLHELQQLRMLMSELIKNKNNV
ncbi:trihelix transcription factor GT-3a-like isoform X2 [Centruroides sculpturatus]|nr:trihelix transcription factor GT-3a-like isoform X2 [Centruroides sculpturatus]